MNRDDAKEILYIKHIKKNEQALFIQQNLQSIIHVLIENGLTTNDKFVEIRDKMHEDNIADYKKEISEKVDKMSKIEIDRIREHKKADDILKQWGVFGKI